MNDGPGIRAFMLVLHLLAVVVGILAGSAFLDAIG